MPRVAVAVVVGALAASGPGIAPRSPSSSGKSFLRVTTLDGKRVDLGGWHITDGQLSGRNGPEPWQRGLRDLWLLAPIVAPGAALQDSQPAPPSARTAAGDDFVLRSGARLRATLVGGDGPRMRFRFASGGFGEVDHRHLSSLRLGPAPAASPAAAPEAASDEGFAVARSSARGDADLLFVRRPDGKIQRFRGKIVGMSDGRVRALIGGRELSLGLDRCYGIIFGRLSGEAPPDPTGELLVSVTLADPAVRAPLRGRLLAASIASGFRIRLLEGLELGLSPDEVAGVEFVSPRLRHLSRLKPANEILTRVLGRKWPVQRDRDRWGAPLEIGDRRYRSGLVLVPNTILTFGIGEKKTRLLGQVGIPKATVGSARVRILADGREIAGPFDLRADGRAITIDETLTGTRELTLDVQATADLDSGARVVFGDFRLVTDA